MRQGKWRGSLSLLVIALLLATGCRHEPPRPLTADDPLPLLDARHLEPIGTPAHFEQLRDYFTSTKEDLILPELADKDEPNALIVIRKWLHREFGPAADDLEFVPIRFIGFTMKNGGRLILRQTYRGVETPGSMMLEASLARVTVFVNLYRLTPTNEPQRHVISARAASDAADAVLRETPNAMTRRKDGDRPVLEYALVEGSQPRVDGGRSDTTMRWDVVWMFRVPGEGFSHEPVVNARNGKVTIGVCGTGLPDLDDGK